MVLPCKFSDGGCKFVGAAAIVKEHEESCTFRKLECPQVFCEANLMMAKVVNHVMNVHGATIYTNLKRTIYWSLNNGEELFASDKTWQPSMTVFDGHVFLLNACIKDLRWVGWAVIIGDKKMAKKYEVSMKAIGHSAEVTVWGDVYSLDISAKEILDDWKGVLQINKKMARKMVRMRADGGRGIAVKYELLRN